MALQLVPAGTRGENGEGSGGCVAERASPIAVAAVMVHKGLNEVLEAPLGGHARQVPVFGAVFRGEEGVAEEHPRVVKASHHCSQPRNKWRTDTAGSVQI